MNDPAENDSRYAAEYLEALRLFNRGLFFESHEELEQLWVRLPKCPDKTFYQAIIHIAAAFLHRSRDRAKPAFAQYRRASEKLLSLGQDEFQGMNIPRLLAQMNPYFLPLENNSVIDSTLDQPIIHLPK
jgi:Domain of unknown function (DUF309).